MNFDKGNGELYIIAAKIENVSKDGNYGNCEVILQLSNNIDRIIEVGTAYARICFVAIVEES